ncbi:MAG: Holliday junction resolvase RuvX [Myxococcales bacterium]|nr:Holliday junction resolvase RuvX [Myxococcales bacterium]MCB9519743.1 Holliday junction resolvase RuvX [Myxococcales bacterium]MCB9530434.1 Holliday junction resolvase RuvX [Myxococcales bacterium]MCB9533681.1 Holliday junction resolvase RuvX [Myxococcales bacterium]
MRALCLDVGTVRIGVAVSDPAGRVATAVETIAARPTGAALDRIVELVGHYDAGSVVVGLPLTLDGTEGGSVRRVRALTAALAPRIDCPIVEWDERLTSVAAERALIGVDVRRDRRREVLDQAAAVLILQAYLDGRATRGG